MTANSLERGQQVDQGQSALKHLTQQERDKLAEECQGLVRHLAQQVRRRLPSWVEMDDLIGYGQVGLMQAARDFDPARGNKFSTFVEDDETPNVSSRFDPYLRFGPSSFPANAGNRVRRGPAVSL